MKIRHDLAEQAIERLAGALGLGVMETAQGIVSVVTANMARAIRVISRAARPRSARLHADGVRRRGAAARRAAGQGARDRPHPGAAQSRHPVRHGPAADRPARRLRRHAADAARPRRSPAMSPRPSPRCAAQAETWFDAEGIAGRCAAHHPHRRHALRRPELRAGGARCPTAPIDAGDARMRWPPASPTAHQRYGFVADGEPVQIVTLRLEATGTVRKAEL